MTHSHRPNEKETELTRSQNTDSQKLPYLINYSLISHEKQVERPPQILGLPNQTNLCFPEFLDHFQFLTYLIELGKMK